MIFVQKYIHKDYDPRKSKDLGKSRECLLKFEITSLKTTTHWNNTKTLGVTLTPWLVCLTQAKPWQCLVSLCPIFPFHPSCLYRHSDPESAAVMRHEPSVSAKQTIKPGPIVIRSRLKKLVLVLAVGPGWGGSDDVEFFRAKT